ncbi:MAG: hypothetical protein R3Y24_05845 [Eubacteriales bacterium]
MFGNKMQTSAIPERVFALCREVMSKPMDENVLKTLLEPQNLGGKTPYFGIVRTAAEQLQLINIKESRISLAVNKDDVKNIDSMRQYINMHLETVSESLFYKVTQGYMDMGTEVLDHNSVSKMSDVIGRNIGGKVNEDDMRAWRFWMSFLGFGYMHDSQAGAAGILLPNTSMFIKDIIEGLKLKRKSEYRIDEFIGLIMPYAKIILNNSIETKSLNYTTSNAIRMLNDLSVIKAEHRLDAQEIWSMHPCEGHDLENTVTHITIGG